MRNTFIFLLCTSKIALAQSPHPWQNFHHDQQHAGYANVTGPQSPSLKWTYYLGTVGFGLAGNSVSVSRTGTIYVCGPGKVTALDRSGALKWTKPYPNAQGPAISNDGKSIYIVSNRNIVSLDTLGNQNWSYTAGDTMIFGVTVSPDDSVIYQGCWDHYVYAIKRNGTLKWKYLTSGCVSYPVTLYSDGTVLVGGGDSHCGSDSTVYALYPNGTLRWKFFINAFNGAHCGSPAIGPDGLIYVAGQPTLYALSINGIQQWNIGSFSNEISGIITPSIAPDTTITLGNYRGVVSSINGTTRDTNWTFQTGPDPNQSNFYGVITFPVTDKYGTVYVGAVDHKIYALNKDGTLKWSYTTGGRLSEASPALGSDGTLYITSDDGYLYAFWDTLMAGAGAPTEEQLGLNIFPNPSEGRFNFELGNTGYSFARVDVMNMLGEPVQSSESCKGKNSFSLEISGLPKGIYMVRMYIGGAVVTRKIVVE